MKLKIINESLNKHTDVVTCIGWTSNNELYSCGDDRKLLRWSGDGEHLGAIPSSLFESPKAANPKLEPASIFYATDIDFLTSRTGSANETFAISGTDGKFYLCSKGGKVEKAVEAHKGAVLALKWNYEGSALVTAGEDGQAKIYSRSGMLRSVLVQSGYPIYSVAWSPDNDSVLHTSGKNLVIKPLQPAQKANTWKGHDGIILKVDWSLVTNLIISSGEDRRYKVWNSYGQCLYTSAAHDHPVTSLSFCPSGEYFAVGSFNMIRVCDKLGWSYAMSRPKSGSIYSISWTPDGSQFAAAGGNGAVLFGAIVGRQWEWKNFEVAMLDEHHLRVTDASNGAIENLDFRDRVLKCSLGYSHLVVSTTSQCYIFSDRNWNTPSIIDIPGGGRVTTIQQCPNYFLIVDTVNGIQIHSYEGRIISSPKYPGLRVEFLTPSLISLSNDLVAIRDHTDEKAVYLFEVSTGRAIHEKPFLHTTDILEVALNPATSSQRFVCLLDKNRDLFISPCMKPFLKKLGNMVDHFIWNEESDMIATITDGKFVTWLYPNVVFVDDDITSYAVSTKDGSSFGRDVQFLGFFGTQCNLRKSDGSIVSVRNVSPFPGLLHEQVKRKQWEEAVRLCRYAKSKELWACLAAMAVHGGDLNTAEVAYAAIDEIQKVQYVCYIKEIPSNEGRAAELALLRRQPREAEGILLGAGLIYRAIRMWVLLFNWDRAFELALKHKTHADTVLYFRQRYLKNLGMKETNAKFSQYSEELDLDLDKIRAKIQMEEESERNRGARRA